MTKNRRAKQAARDLAATTGVPYRDARAATTATEPTSTSPDLAPGPLRVLVLSPKGGAGRTVFAAALAQHAASQNVTVVVRDWQHDPDAVPSSGSSAARWFGTWHPSRGDGIGYVLARAVEEAAVARAGAIIVTVADVADVAKVAARCDRLVVLSTDDRDGAVGAVGALSQLTSLQGPAEALARHAVTVLNRVGAHGEQGLSDGVLWTGLANVASPQVALFRLPHVPALWQGTTLRSDKTTRRRFLVRDAQAVDAFNEEVSNVWARITSGPDDVATEAEVEDALIVAFDAAVQSGAMEGSALHLSGLALNAMRLDGGLPLTLPEKFVVSYDEPSGMVEVTAPGYTRMVTGETVEAKTYRFPAAVVLPDVVPFPEEGTPAYEEWVRAAADGKVIIGPSTDTVKGAVIDFANGGVLIGGAAGMGKSVLVDLILHAARIHPDRYEVALCGLNGWPKGLTSDIARLRGAAAGNVEETIAAAEWAVEVMEQRYATLAADGGRSPLSEPWLLFIVDEAGAMMSPDPGQGQNGPAATLRALVDRLSREGRAARVVPVITSQRPTADTIGSALRANLTHRVWVGSASPAAAVLMFGDTTVDGLAPRGRAQIQTDTGSQPMQAQTYVLPH